MAAEVATILQAAESIPSAQGRRASREERQEAYLAYQRESYRLMARINHLATLAQLDMMSWREMCMPLIPLIPPFIEIMLPTEPSKQANLRRIQDFATSARILTKAVRPMAESAIVATYRSYTQLRGVSLDAGWSIGETSGEFMAALAEIRLIGRSCPVAAADTIRALLQELSGAIPTKDTTSFYLRAFVKSPTKEGSRLERYNDCLTALGEANAQFTSTIRNDHHHRERPWHAWRPKDCQIRTAHDLLNQVRHQQ